MEICTFQNKLQSMNTIQQMPIRWSYTRSQLFLCGIVATRLFLTRQALIWMHPENSFVYVKT